MLERWMPPAAATWAEQVDFINAFITYVAAFCTIGITGVMLYFAIKYKRRSENDVTPYITHNRTLETVWTVVPTIVVIFVFAYGTWLYEDKMRNPPANAIEIGVKGYQWFWEFNYPTGKRANEHLVVPVNRPIKLIMKSNDVNHSFFIPAMRVKEDVIASEYHFLWFQPTKLGTYRVFCAEYCGDQHSGMLGDVQVVTEAEYEDFINDRTKGDQPKLTPEELGKQVWDQKGCKACHSLDGAKMTGPSWKGLFGKERVFTDGSKATADENYIRESVLTPTAKVVQDFPPAMPALQINDEELAGVIAFIKTLK